MHDATGEKGDDRQATAEDELPCLGEEQPEREQGSSRGAQDAPGMFRRTQRRGRGERASGGGRVGGAT